MTRFEDAVRRVLEDTRPGEVLTYGEVAAEAGYPGAARAVGNFLRQTTVDVPWHRVVGAGDRLVSHLAAEQAALLRTEGLRVEGGRVRRASPA
ncbi:MAG: DNA methyltransferase [Nitriliruptorales bacterium]|nr:DNA methyltransferase [Nitriliruptorales bacterium]